MKKLALPVLVSVVAVVAVASSVRAHEDKTDPVCGMRVDPDVVPWKADFAGETYYFCMQADRDAFLADPERYAGALTLTSAREKHELVLVVRPRVPTAGSTVKLIVRGFGVGDRMASPPRPPRPLGAPEAVVYEIDRTASPRPERYTLASIKGSEDEAEAAYGLARLATTAGSWRVVVDADLDGGRRRGIFTIPIAPVSTATVVRADEHAGHPKPMEAMPGMGELSMSAQHETMKEIGQHWYALGDWLRGGPGTAEQASDHMSEVERAARNVPLFMLHKFPESAAEFKGYAADFTRELPRVRGALASRDRANAYDEFRKLDAQNCTKCHLKFRWASAEDLSRFPDLRLFPRGK